MWGLIFILVFVVSLFLESWLLGNKSKIFRDFIIKLTLILAMITITLINFKVYPLWVFIGIIVVELAYLVSAIVIYMQDKQLEKEIEDMAKDKEK